MADPNKGTIHVMEEQMREAGQGVFEQRRQAKGDAAPKSTTKRKARK